MTIDRYRTIERLRPFGTAVLAGALAALLFGAAPAAAQPTPLNPEVYAAAGNLVSIRVDGAFGNAGTNPRYAEVTFDTLDYYDQSRTGLLTEEKERLFVKVKTREELRALASPPPTPFTVDVTVRMENDEGETATGTITWRTVWDAPAQAASPATPPNPTMNEQPTAKAGLEWNLIRDLDMLVQMGEVFDNAGTYPTFTSVTFSPAEYVKDGSGGLNDNHFTVARKTDADLNALASPPLSSFTFTADVAMANDEGETATASLTFRASYDRAQAPDQALSSVSATPTPSAKTGVIDLPLAGERFNVSELFDSAGTNPKFTKVSFSTREYYVFPISGDFEGIVGTVPFLPKSAAALNALPSPPPSPFTVDVTLTMTNDEEQTATGTFTFRTTYEKQEETAPAEESAPAGPTLKSQGTTKDLDPGASVTVKAEDVFDHAGTNPKFTDATFSTKAYYVPSWTGISGGELWVKARSSDYLNALSTRPPDPFTVTVVVTMTNDEGETGSGTLTFQTDYDKDENPAPTPPFATPDDYYAVAGSLYTIGVTNMFGNAGTNPRFTEVKFDKSEYFVSSRTGIDSSRTNVLNVWPKTVAELDALSDPPADRTEVTVTAKMENDEGLTAEGTGTIVLRIFRNQGGANQPSGPTAKAFDVIDARPDEKVDVYLDDLFDNTGTNPRITGSSITAGYLFSTTSRSRDRIAVQIRNARGLRAHLAQGASNPLTESFTVTMGNDEGETAEATVTVRVTVPPNPT